MLIFITLLFVCIVLVIGLLKYKRKYWEKYNVIQAEDLLWRFITEGRSIAEIGKEIYDKYDEPYIATYMGIIPTLILKNREDIQAVMASDFQSFFSRGIPNNKNDLLADNLLFMHDFQRWKILRQKLTPVFTSSRLKNMFCNMEKCARDFVTFIENNESVREDPFSGLYTYTTASIGASVFGIDTQTKNTMDSPFLEMAWKSVKPSLYTNVVVTIANLSPYLFKLLKLKIFGDHEKFFLDVVKNVLDHRRQTNEKRNDFIDICLEIQKQGAMKDVTTGFELILTDKLLAAQAFFFFLAGSDTSANTMHFTLLELSNNPKILLKLHEEIDNLFSDLNNPDELSYNDIDKLEYLDKVINEAVRKYPPIGFITRICTKDTFLPSRNLKIEKDVSVAIPVYALHRDENYYPNPELFDPERFSSENVSNIPKYAYLPFGEGNRICIGMRFARLQVKAGLAWLLRRFTLKEQKYNPKTFEASPFALRDAKAKYHLIIRDI